MRRPSTARDRYDLPLSTSSPQAVADYVLGVDLVLSGNIGAEVCLRQAILADEGFALAHAALASVDLRWRRFNAAREGIQRARRAAQGTSRRERQHIEVIAETVNGSPARALSLAAAHLDEFPNDAYILQQYVFLRRGPGCRDLNRAILDTIERLEPAYGDDWYYTGTRSFYLHELDRFNESRRYAEASLSGNPRNGNAAHNLAHCFYETADYTGGLDFLSDWIVDYHPESPHYSHLNWHMALFELTQGRYQQSYDIYRSNIRPSVLKHDIGGMGPPVADATSLFWRYRLYGSPLGQSEDWQEIGAFATYVATGPRMPFFDAHCALAFAATRNEGAMQQLIDGVRESAGQGNALARDVTLPLVLGIAAFGNDDYEGTIRHMEPIIDDLARIDGSQAQRMVFEETLLRAYMMSGKHDSAEEMLRQRLEHRHSGRDFFWLADISSRVGSPEQAAAYRQSGQRFWQSAEPNTPELTLFGTPP